MEEGLLKEDGRKAMKKTRMAFSVFALAVAMAGAAGVGLFASGSGRD